MSDQAQIKVGAQTLALVANMSATIFAARQGVETMIPVDRQNIIVESVGAAFEIMKEVSNQEADFNYWLATRP